MRREHTIVEHQLQQLWQDKRLPFHLFRLTNGTSVDIIRTGTWNLAGSGPDFQMAEIQYDNLRWFGSVEFHLKSSDWYKHQHHDDQSYDNVILHVVFEHDQEVYVQNKFLPTLELKPYLSGEFSIPHRYDWTKTTHFPCKAYLRIVSSAFEHMQHLAIKQRLQRKFQLAFEKGTVNDSIYRLISTAFGTKTNSLSFEILAQQIPLEWHQKKTKAELLRIIESNEQGWKSKNRILQTHMYRRVNAWLQFIQWYFHDDSRSFLERNENLNEGFKKAGITSKLLKDNIRINAITYVEMWLAQSKSQTASGLFNGMKYLKQLPSERHQNTRIWENLGIRAKNALETQANLEIYQQFCTSNKCLHCSVGQQLLKP